MINILKLRKLEKENKQRKLQDENTSGEQTVTAAELIPEDEIPAKQKPAPKKVKSAKKKSGKNIEQPPLEQPDQINGDENITDIEITADPIKDPEKEVKEEPEINPVEIFRQNLLNELLNSDSLPEFSDSQITIEQERTDSIPVVQSSAIINDQQIKSSGEEITQTQTVPSVNEQKPEQLEQFNNTIEKARKIHDSLIHLVSFSLGKENYGVDIMRIREIIRMVDITKVPRAPEFIEGVINLRGSVIPVINLRTRIKLPWKEYDKSTRIIVMELKQAVIGFIVDEVKEVLRITESIIAPPPLLTIGKKVEYITGVAKLETCLIILIEPEKLLSGNELDKLK